MRKIIYLSFALLQFSVLSFAQSKQSLEVDYQTEIKLKFEDIIKQVPAAYRSQVEEPLKQEINKGIFLDYKLKTDGVKSVYALQPKLDNSQNAAGMIVSQISTMDKEPLYKDFTNKFFYKTYDLGAKKTIVKEPLYDFKWKISKEKQNIAGFDALKAEGVMNDSVKCVVWYTPKLNFKDGPDRFNGLPGLILKAEFKMRGADLIVTAKNVTVNDADLQLKLPEGKTITEAEFMEEMKKIQEQYKQMMEGGVDTDN